MLTLPTSLRVFAKTGPTDMRRSFEGLVGLVERELHQQVESGDLFLFFNRRSDRVKVLWFAGDGLVIWYKRLEHGGPDFPESLAQCQQRIGQLEETVAQQQQVIAHQAAVIAQQQEMAAAYQEQLAKAAEQLRYFKRAMFGQRRERYAPSPDQKLLFVPEAIGGLDTKAQSAEEAAADSSAPRPRRKPRRPRIEFPQFWEHRKIEYPLPPEELPCGCCGAERSIIRTHVTKRAEMEEAKLYVIEEVRYTYGCSACHDGSPSSNRRW